MMPRVTLYMAFILVLSLLLGALLLNGRQTANRQYLTAVPAKRELVARLGLSDLSIWTEARYTRHLSQADLFAAFQDQPAAADYFPAGSVVAAVQAKPTTRIRVQKAAR